MPCGLVAILLNSRKLRRSFQSPDQAAGVVRTVIDIWFRLLDTAKNYANEAEVGEDIGRSGVARRILFVTTKLWIEDFGYDGALRVRLLLSGAAISRSRCNEESGALAIVRSSTSERPLPSGAVVRRPVLE